MRGREAACYDAAGCDYTFVCYRGALGQIGPFTDPDFSPYCHRAGPVHVGAGLFVKDQMRIVTEMQGDVAREHALLANVDLSEVGKDLESPAGFDRKVLSDRDIDAMHRLVGPDRQAEVFQDALPNVDGVSVTADLNADLGTVVGICDPDRVVAATYLDAKSARILNTYRVSVLICRVLSCRERAHDVLDPVLPSAVRRVMAILFYRSSGALSR